MVDRKLGQELPTRLMPYIDPRDRVLIDSFHAAPTKPGELNYIISRLIDEYLGDEEKPLGYSRYNEVVGVLECVKLELHRRFIGPYEEDKRHENGEVFDKLAGLQ